MVSLDPINILIALILLGLLAVLSYKKQIVTKSGLVTAYFLGLAIWLLTSWTWFVLILIFFLVTAQFTQFKYQQKHRFGAAQEKSGARNWSHVLANGALPLSLVISGFVLLSHNCITAYGRFEVGLIPMVMLATPAMQICFAAYLGALSTITADTLATEIGLLNPHPPRLITRPRKKVPPGTSGGVSLAGELATLLGPLLIGGVAAFLAHPFWFTLFGTTLMPELGNFAPITMILVAVVGGFIGCTVDSLFGATIQGMWQCQVCGKQTEKRKHCGEPANHLRGNRFVDNHMVNLTSSLIGALVAALIYIALLLTGFH